MLGAREKIKVEMKKRLLAEGKVGATDWQCSNIMADDNGRAKKKTTEHKTEIWPRIPSFIAGIN